MIRTIWQPLDGQVEYGAEELIVRWQGAPGSTLWIDLYQESQKEEQQLLLSLGFHALAIQDAQRQRHPPKLELFDDHLFILLRGLDAESHNLEFGTIQIALFAKPDLLVTRRSGVLVSIDHWRREPGLPALMAVGGIRLAMEIAATAARRYLDLLLAFEPRLSELEDQLQEKPDDSAMRELTGYRTRLRKLRRIFSYHARLFEALREEESPVFNAKSDDNRHLLNDVYEKYERLYSLSGMYYELAGDLVDGYISLSSHELNRTMRILTVLTAIFVPLSFLAGLYGMNFDNMPELHWRGSYFVLLGAMLTIATTLLALFKKNKWL